MECISLGEMIPHYKLGTILSYVQYLTPQLPIRQGHFETSANLRFSAET
jgi:hypothetical protein